ncbi:MAG: hypothetical protein GXY41_07185 [Phycisphaerae bacterium]|nr:hypothetical protein [Phycisphaerae bacterium]
MSTKNGDYCSRCPQKGGCKEVYERLGASDAPNVVGKVFLAFLLPIALFVGLLVVFDAVLPGFEVEKWRTLAVFGLSVVPTLAVVWVIKSRNSKH